MKTKMKCREIENNLIAYIEKSLPMDTMQDFELHLQECNACKLLLGKVNATYQSFEFSSIPQLKPFFITRVEAKIHHKKHLPAFVPRYTILNKIAASVLILVGIGIGVFIGGKLPSPISSASTTTQSEMLETYASEYNLDDSGFGSLETIMTNE